MRVEAVIRRRGIQNPCAETGEVGLCDVLHVLSDSRGRVLDAGGVLVGRSGQDVGALKRVGTSLVDIVHDSTSPDGRGIHTTEDIESFVPL